MLDILSAVFGFVVSNKYYLLSAFTMLVMVRAILFRGVFDPKKYPDSFAEYKEVIRTEKWGEQYLSWLRKLSNWLTNLIGDHHRFPEQAPSKQPFWQHLKSNNPWTVKSYEFCLVLAIFYSFVSFIVSWVISGQGVLGSTKVFIENVVWHERFLYITVFLSAAIFLGWSRGKGGLWRVVGFICALPAALLINFWLSNDILVVATTLSVFVASSLLLGSAKPVALTVVSQVLGLSILLISSNIGYLFYGMNVVALFLVPVLLVGVYIYLASTYYVFISDKRVFWFGLNVLVLPSVIYGLSIGGFDRLTSLTVLVFVLLPLMNAVVDWLSLGVTRHLLQRLQVDHGWSHAILWAAIDLVLALVFLFLISMVLVSVVSVANVFAVNSVLDLKAVFASLRDTSDHRSDFWVYFLLLSTLIPTLIHFSLVGGALTRSVPVGWRQRMVDGIGKHEHRTWEAYAYLVFTPAVGFVLAPTLLLSLLWWIASTHGGVIGFGLLDMAEWLALWIDPTLGHVEVLTSHDR